jgi:hypothetical protein
MYQHHSRLGFLNVFLDRDRASTATGRPRKCRKPYAPAGRRGCADTTGKNHNLKRDVKHKFLGMMVYIINELAAGRTSWQRRGRRAVPVPIGMN